MDDIIQFLEKWWKIIVDFVNGLTPEQQLMAVGVIGVLLLLFIIKKVTRSKKKGTKKFKRTKHKNGILSIDSYRVAPLGRDAFLKIKNNKAAITLTQLSVLNPGVLVKNALAGQKLAPGKTYSILLESKDANKIPENLEIEITFLNANNVAEKESFVL